MVTTNTLVQGVWFAMEQAGRLLRSAVCLYDARDFGSAVALAMFAHEELGRSRILLDLAVDGNRGSAIDAKQLRKACNEHIEKQRRGAFSVSSRINQGDPLATALSARTKAALGSPEYKVAQAAIDQQTEAIADAQPLARHKERMSAVYLELAPDDKNWNRPAAIEPLMAFDRVHAAVNDYSVGKQWFEESLLSAEHEKLLDPKIRLLRAARPPGLTLPPAKWPQMPT